MAAAAALPSLETRAEAAEAAGAALPFDLGIASYTFRSFTLDQAIAMDRRLRMRKITLKDMHLPMAVTRTRWRRCARS